MNRDMDEESAIRKVKAGDCGAFGYLVAKYRRPVLGFIFNLIKELPLTWEEAAPGIFAADRGQTNRIWERCWSRPWIPCLWSRE